MSSSHIKIIEHLRQVQERRVKHVEISLSILMRRLVPQCSIVSAYSHSAYELPMKALDELRSDPGR
jgi:hypothetical protein